MTWPLLCLALAIVPTSAKNNPLMAGVFFRYDREILRTFAPCERIAEDPPTARCRAKVYGHESETIFVFDGTRHVHLVLLAFAPVPRIEDTQDVIRTLADTLSGQFGPPSVQKNDAGAVWTWTNDHGIATVKLTKSSGDSWFVTASLKEGGLPGRFGDSSPK
jgi:hypothetical protein